MRSPTSGVFTDLCAHAGDLNLTEEDRAVWSSDDTCVELLSTSESAMAGSHPRTSTPVTRIEGLTLAPRSTRDPRAALAHHGVLDVDNLGMKPSWKGDWPEPVTTWQKAIQEFFDETLQNGKEKLKWLEAIRTEAENAAGRGEVCAHGGRECAWVSHTVYPGSRSRLHCGPRETRSGCRPQQPGGPRGSGAVSACVGYTCVCGLGRYRV